MGGPSYYPLGRSGDSDMSEGERMAMDCMDEEEEEAGLDPFERMVRERLDHIDGPKGYWNSTTGPVPIREMTDSHIANALKWLAKYQIEDSEKGAELRSEQARRRRAKKAKVKTSAPWPPPPGSLRRSP